MDIYGLVGKSGTGKSHNVYNLSKELNIEYIIDDGILIKNNSLVGGVSAKSENSKIRAVKRAIFFYKDHKYKMKEILNRENPKKLLIVGTSEKMIRKILKSLELENVKEYIYIDSILTKENIEKSLEIRKKEGKHLIPLPNFEIEKDFAGYFMERFISKKKNLENNFYEGTVVRPTFSYMGKYTIKDKVVKDIIIFLSRRERNIYKIKKITVEGKYGRIYLFIDLIIHYPSNLIEVTKSFQKTIYKEITWITGLYIEKTYFHIVGVKVDRKIV